MRKRNQWYLVIRKKNQNTYKIVIIVLGMHYYKCEKVTYKAFTIYINIDVKMEDYILRVKHYQKQKGNSSVIQMTFYF